MKKYNKDQIIELVKNAIDRFIGEMAPYWSKENVLKLLNPPGFQHELSENVVQEAFEFLETSKVIIRVGQVECYFIISEDEVKKYYDGEFCKIVLQQIKQLRTKFNV